MKYVYGVCGICGGVCVWGMCVHVCGVGGMSSVCGVGMCACVMCVRVVFHKARQCCKFHHKMLTIHLFSKSFLFL